MGLHDSGNFAFGLFLLGGRRRSGRGGGVVYLVGVVVKLALQVPDFVHVRCFDLFQRLLELLDALLILLCLFGLLDFFLFLFYLRLYKEKSMFVKSVSSGVSTDLSFSDTPRNKLKQEKKKKTALYRLIRPQSL